jgi:isopentenyl-diphosphate Delta-isomerase
MQMANDVELVVLVDREDRPIGTMEKDEVHTHDTPLHRAFSCFVFNPPLHNPTSQKLQGTRASEGQVGDVLVTQRSLKKKTWPGAWSNSFCGHPMPGESREEALHRRAAFELGMRVMEVKKVADYTYRFERDGVVEHEVCPIYIARAASDISLNPDEVGAYEWMGWDVWLDVLRRDEAGEWTEWCKEEAEIVDAFLNS